MVFEIYKWAQGTLHLLPFLYGRSKLYGSNFFFFCNSTSATLCEGERERDVESICVVLARGPDNFIFTIGLRK